MDTHTLDRLAARHDWRPETRPGDVDAARDADEHVTARTLLERCRRAASAAVPTRAEHEREDLAADLAEWVARKHGWTPKRGQVRHHWLTLKARNLAADRTGWRDSLNRPEVDAADADPGSVLAQEAGTVGPADVDADRVAEALGMDADERAAVVAILTGYGSALDLAGALGISHEAARKRLQRGREKLRLRWPTARHAAEALEDLAARDLTRDLAAGSVPVDGRYPDGPTAAARVLAWIDAAPARGRILAADPAPALAAMMSAGDRKRHAAGLAERDRDPAPAPAATVTGPAPTRAARVLAWIAAVETGAVTGQVQEGERPHGEPSRRPVRDRKNPGTALPQGRTPYGWTPCPDLPARPPLKLRPDRGGYVSPLGSAREEAARQAEALARVEAVTVREECKRLPLTPGRRVLAYLERVTL